jgi:PAS domain S-box-containing protein
MNIQFQCWLHDILRSLLPSANRRRRKVESMNSDTTRFNDIRDIEDVVETFKRLVSQLSRDGNHLGDLCVTAERKAARYALLSETVVESITTGIIVVERGGEIGLVNSAARHLLGIDEAQEIAGKDLLSLFREGKQLESLVKENFRTSDNSARQILTVETLDGRCRQLGASTSCVSSHSDKVEAVIVAFTDLGTPQQASKIVDRTEVRELEKQSYLRGILDSYDLVSEVMADLTGIHEQVKAGTLSETQILRFTEIIREARDLMMAFALSLGSSNALTELVDMNGVIESLLERKKDLANLKAGKRLCAEIPRVKTIRKVLEAGLELLLSGCAADSGEGIDITTSLVPDKEPPVVRVTVRERDPGKPIVDVGHSLREFIKVDNHLREVGLYLLRSLPQENHHLAVDSVGRTFCFSLDVSAPIENKAGPTTHRGDVSEMGQDGTKI